LYEPGRIETYRDLNGDGRPEALVTEGSLYCYGNTGQGFRLLSKQANGSWKVLHQSQGIADFLPTLGVSGRPDIFIGGPGLCRRVVRWNGNAYETNRFQDYDGMPCKL
jgi:hypothetical protein